MSRPLFVPVVGRTYGASCPLLTGGGHAPSDRTEGKQTEGLSVPAMGGRLHSPERRAEVAHAGRRTDRNTECFRWSALALAHARGRRHDHRATRPQGRSQPTLDSVTLDQVCRTSSGARSTAHRSRAASVGTLPASAVSDRSGTTASGGRGRPEGGRPQRWPRPSPNRFLQGIADWVVVATT
jgi:hypothetical protein